VTLDLLRQAVRDLAAFQSLAHDLPQRGARLALRGLPGSTAALVVSELVRAAPGRLVVVVVPAPHDAERWLADLETLAPGNAVLYPQREALGEEEPHFEIAGERIETLEALNRGTVRVVVTTARATAERTTVPAALEAARLELQIGWALGLTEAVARLDAMGYERVPAVTDVGQFSVRGGLVDMYGFGMAGPARVEWWGDEIVTLRAFDLTSQRSEGSVEGVTVLPLTTAGLATEGLVRRSLLDLVPPDALAWMETPNVTYSEVDRAWSEAAHHLEVARRIGEEVPDRDELFVAPETWRQALERLPRIEAADEATEGQALPFLPPESIARDLARLRRLIARPPETIILCDNDGQRERLEELLEDRNALPPGVILAVGALSGGFVVPGVLRVLTDHEIFRRARRLRRPRRYRQAAPGSVVEGLRSGDHVVHLEHGIGIYRGIETIAAGGGEIEVAVVEYEGGDRLNVPLYRIDQLEPYRSTSTDGDAPPPKLHRLGGTSWHRQREKAQAAIRVMAVELLDLYARRQVSPGFPYPPDTPWQRALESSFLYEDTPDQRQATDVVKRDLERPRPMDRLVVGDVGYGKTEVAIRAAFKVVQAGKQAAVLVPTTILAEQHGRTFGDRLADFPVEVAVLSRFRTAAEQRTIVGRLASGQVDIAIGTHRLLSKDVVFKDLGLLVVDEEHRFGVRHKERLKQLRLEVDVLTLTATPIPRTLSLSLAGLRDLTMIETPPRDRSPVLTYLEPWDDGLIEEAIARELDRGGQVFVVHNRIETIETVAARVERLAPRASTAVAHGQMRERELDGVMRRFVDGTVQVLVSTMIVESGLDVPNANTMVVHDAHRFGLAQLYQLRGRVGRGHRRAFCYLIVPDQVDRLAEERLKVLEHHTALGVGYRVALRDLELRGAGSLLGADQSGHAQAVGFDVYLRWLDEGVRRLKGDVGAQPAGTPADVVLDRPAYLPDDYVTDDAAKLDFYRRLARARAIGDISQLRDELRDRFGALPEPAERLLVVAELRASGAGAGVETVLVRGDEARLAFRSNARPRLAGLTAALDSVQFAAEVRRAQPLVLKLTRLGGETIERGLVRALRAVQPE
jgi:transcription-repair coupling factor (superfamily II helicase)